VISSGAGPLDASAADAEADWHRNFEATSRRVIAEAQEKHPHLYCIAAVRHMHAKMSLPSDPLTAAEWDELLQPPTPDELESVSTPERCDATEERMRASMRATEAENARLEALAIDTGLYDPSLPLPPAERARRQRELFRDVIKRHFRDLRQFSLLLSARRRPRLQPGQIDAEVEAIVVKHFRLAAYANPPPAGVAGTGLPAWEVETDLSGGADPLRTPLTETERANFAHRHTYAKLRTSLLKVGYCTGSTYSHYVVCCCAAQIEDRYPGAERGVHGGAQSLPRKALPTPLSHGAPSKELQEVAAVLDRNTALDATQRQYMMQYYADILKVRCTL
jgi:hypothetical protein